MCHLHADTTSKKADVIAHQRTASIAFRLGSNMMNFGGNYRAIAANCGDNPDKLRFLGRGSSQHVAASLIDGL